MSNRKYRPTLVFVSNPFGYGPTGTLVPVIKEFEQKTELPLVFLGAGLCLEVIRNNPVEWKRLKIIEGNERDISFLSSSITELKNPHVISSLNRFVIQVANKNKIPNALIDSLGWFWEKRPEGFDLADIYFYNNFGSKLEVSNSLSYKIPLIITGHATSKQTDSIIFNIGGAKNPLVNGLQKNYLKLLILLIDRLPRIIQKKIIITGGRDAIKFLKKEDKTNECVCSFRSFSYFEFEEQISSSQMVITPAGMGVTLSSVFLQKPIIIYLPENLSQIKLGKVISDRVITPYVLEWGNYISTFNSDTISEGDSILEIDNYSLQVIRNRKIFEKLLKDFSSKVNQALKQKVKPDLLQLKFGGERLIFNTLQKIWNLT